MMKIIYLLISLFIASIHASNFTIITNENFPLQNLTAKQLKSIYLKKVRYIDGVKIFAINIKANNQIRDEFETVVLHMSKKSLKNYWNKAHYRGVRPPKVLKSNQNILSYVSSIDGAIAYIPTTLLDEKIHTIKVQY